MQTLEQAQAGSEIVVWPELAGVGVEEDVQTLIADAQALAQEEGIYLIACGGYLTHPSRFSGESAV